MYISTGAPYVQNFCTFQYIIVLMRGLVPGDTAYCFGSTEGCNHNFLYIILFLFFLTYLIIFISKNCISIIVNVSLTYSKYLPEVSLSPLVSEISLLATNQVTLSLA